MTHYPSEIWWSSVKTALTFITQWRELMNFCQWPITAITKAPSTAAAVCTLLYSVLYFTLHCTLLFYLVLHNTLLCTLHYILTYSTLLYSIMHSDLQCTLHHSVFNSTLNSTIEFCCSHITVLHCTLQHYTLLQYNVLIHSMFVLHCRSILL